MYLPSDGVNKEGLDKGASKYGAPVAGRTGGHLERKNGIQDVRAKWAAADATERGKMLSEKGIGRLEYMVRVGFDSLPMRVQQVLVGEHKNEDSAAFGFESVEKTTTAHRDEKENGDTDIERRVGGAWDRASGDRRVGLLILSGVSATTADRMRNLKWSGLDSSLQRAVVESAQAGNLSLDNAVPDPKCPCGHPMSDHNSGELEYGCDICGCTEYVLKNAAGGPCDNCGAEKFTSKVRVDGEVMMLCTKCCDAAKAAGTFEGLANDGDELADLEQIERATEAISHEVEELEKKELAEDEGDEGLYANEVDTCYCAACGHAMGEEEMAEAVAAGSPECAACRSYDVENDTDECKTCTHAKNMHNEGMKCSSEMCNCEAYERMMANHKGPAAPWAVPENKNMPDGTLTDPEHREMDNAKKFVFIDIDGDKAEINAGSIEEAWKIVAARMEEPAEKLKQKGYRVIENDATSDRGVWDQLSESARKAWLERAGVTNRPSSAAMKWDELEIGVQTALMHAPGMGSMALENKDIDTEDIGKEIGHHIKEKGMDPKQAVAVALKEAGKSKYNDVSVNRSILQEGLNAGAARYGTIKNYETEDAKQDLHDEIRSRTGKISGINQDAAKRAAYDIIGSARGPLKEYIRSHIGNEFDLQHYIENL